MDTSSTAIRLPSYAQFHQAALDIGFSQMAILHHPQLTEAGEHLKQWLSQQFHADMQWMQTHLDKRLDPTSLMENTQSIVCVTINYYNGDIPSDAPLKIARYAQGDDYHDVVKTKLKQLLKWLQTFDTRIEGRALTDSAPILEKALAVQAGLGWQGKHSNLITLTDGSWVFLGELLLNVVFPDAPTPQPVPDYCGRCRRCITACPTDAIVDNAIVDANRCISYWTIESKAETMPDNIAHNLQGWLFGCDICQEVCPWNNKRQHLTQEVAFWPRPWNQDPISTEIQHMQPEGFKTLYRKSPIKRAKLQGLQRNLKAIVSSSSDLPQSTTMREDKVK